jgi:hypothetical protein
MTPQYHVKTHCTISAGLHNITDPWSLQQHCWFVLLKNVDLDAVLRSWYRVEMKAGLLM